jgi:hypothetical protein
LIFPGFAFASSMSSAIERGGNDGCTTVQMRLIGVKIANRVVRQLAADRGIDRVRARGGEQRIAVGYRAGGDLRRMLFARLRQEPAAARLRACGAYA